MSDDHIKLPIFSPQGGDVPHTSARAPKHHEGYLEGQLLVATPLVVGDFFTHSVIYLFAHNAHGAMGVIVNKPLEMVHYASLFAQLGIEVTPQAQDLPVYLGGPVEESRGFVLHSADYNSGDGLVHENKIALTASTQILKDIAAGKGPARRMLTIGYAGWAPGQLESEIEANSWITVAATPDLIFGTDDDAKWAVAAKSLGVDMSRYSSFIGHA